jgi:hypothetical protein
MEKARYLEAADRNIRDTEGLIVRQRELIQRMAAGGRETFYARRLLEALEDALERYRAQRALIARLNNE